MPLGHKQGQISGAQRSRARRSANGMSAFAGSVASLACLILLVVGVPLLLVAERAGLPLGVVTRVLGHPSLLLHSLERPVTDNTVIDAVVLTAWLAWAWLAVCLCAEVLARLRGRPAARLPASRHAQALAAVLIGASMAVLPLVRSYPPIRVAGTHSRAATYHIAVLADDEHRISSGLASSDACVVRAAVDSSGAQTKPLKSRDSGGGEAGVLREYRVLPGDTLWSIARQQLGSPLRWKEIAQLNADRKQADGKAFLDAGWILPGWVLVLPAAAPPITEPHGSQDAATVSAPLVTSHVTRDDSEHPRAGGATSTTSHHRVTRTTLSTGSRVSAPTVGHGDPVGSTRPTHGALTDPTDSAASAQIGSATETSTTDSSTSGAIDGAGRQPTQGAKAGSTAKPNPAHGPYGLPFAPFGYGLLGAGVVTVINRLRRAQQRHRPTGLRIALPEQELANAEQRLRSSADPESSEWVDATLRTLAAACRRNERSAPRVVAVRVLEAGTELVLASPSDAERVMKPFEVHDSRSSWFLPRSEELLDEAQSDPWIAGMDVISPGLVTLGRDTQGLLLVDVERAGSVELTGDASDDVLRAMAIELATSSWSEQVNVVVVGLDRQSVRLHADPTLDVLDRVRLVGSLVEVLPELRHLTTERSVMLDAVGFDRSSDARLAVSGDGWDLTVVFCSSQAVSANQKAVVDLVTLAAEGDRGLAVVCAGATVGAKWRLQVGNGPTSLRLSGTAGPSDGPEMMLWPQTVDREAEEQIAKLVEVARKFEGVDPSTPPYDSLETRPVSVDVVEYGSGGCHDTDPSHEGDIEHLVGDLEPPPAIEILVLGPVKIIGAARPFTRAWSLELVVYLAMHPGGATSDQWATHLWPSRSMAQASLHSTASAARRALGSTATGEDHLPRSHGRLALGPGVATDWDRFCHLSASTDPSAWRLALGLVRGRPFDGLRSTDWAVFSHVQANIESLVVDVSVRTSEHCLETEDPSGAEWAARQGLLVSPYDERLYRILMRAAYQAGNPAGVEASMTELLQLVGGEVEPYDSVHPETYALYRSLSRKHVSARQR